MKRRIVGLMLVLLVAAMCQATVINDFESYANTLALKGEWTNTANLTITLDTTDVHSGTKSMKYTGSTWNSPWYLKSEYRLAGVEWGVSGLNWTGMSTLSLWVKPTASKGCFKMSIVDCYGNNIYLMNWGVLPVGQWINLTWNLNGPDAYGDMLTASERTIIGRIDIVAKKETAFAPNSQDGTNTYFIDDITVVPEPATMLILGLGSLLLRKLK